MRKPRMYIACVFIVKSISDVFFYDDHISNASANIWQFELLYIALQFLLYHLAISGLKAITHIAKW